MKEQRAINKKEALKEQMKIEQEERECIQSVKEKEKMQTSREIELFKMSNEVVREKKEEKRGEEETVQKKNQKQVVDEVEEALPEPRVCRTLQVTFTPRVFPTPQRESTQRQENEVSLDSISGLVKFSLVHIF